MAYGRPSVEKLLGALPVELDDLHRSLFAVLDYPDWAYGAGVAVDAAQLSQYYERFGDHAVSILVSLRASFPVDVDQRRVGVPDEPGRQRATTDQ